MKRGHAIALPLPIWQDPQSNLQLRFAAGRAEVEFDCWNADGNEADFTGVVVFEGVWATRSVGSEFVPFEVQPHQYHSYILRVEASAWIEELADARNAAYTDWPRTAAAEYSHYIVVGHGDYAEIIARSFRVEQRPIHPAPHAR
ncbi:MAG TPA: hypothetical protein VFO89_08765 [Thermoanaerobaculia bacterium]|nr:hypothetical protein [Thermoanaerobaculia bacterium]